MQTVMGVLCACLLAGLAGPAAARAWKVDAAHSTLTFTNSYQGVQYSGRFGRFAANIAYDPHDVAHAKFEVTVDIASLDTQNGERDRAALGAAFFDASQFPRAFFTTTAFHSEAGNVTADGELKLHGVVRPVRLDVIFAPHGDTATLDVTAHLRRLDFGIGSGEWADPELIGDGVVVHGHLLLDAKP